MPKSKVRKKAPYSAPATPAGSASVGSRAAKPSGPVYAGIMAAFLVIGLLYIVVYYMAGGSVPVMKDLGNWNFGVGFGFLVVGLGMAVRWR